MIALFVEPKFPTLGTAPIKIADLRKALASIAPVATWDSARLREATPEKARLLVLPYGSAFPEEAWPALYAYLQAGGNLLVLGGRPFECPIRRKADGWEAGEAQTAFYQSLGIEQLNTVSADEIKCVAANSEEPWLENCDLPPVDAHSLMARLTDADEDEGRSGTVGPMNSSLVPLAWGIDKNGRRLSCPATLLEHRQGPFEGGRWVFAACRFTTWGARENEWAVRLAACAWIGALEAEVRPVMACYRPGAQPDLSVWVRGHKFLKRKVRLDWTLSLEGATVREGSFEYAVDDASQYASAPLPVAVEPGFYRLETRVSVDGHLVRVAPQGFWGWDDELVKTAPRWDVSGDRFTLDGRDQNVVGTTYMAGDVSRKFLTHPNPAVWDRDFSEMAADGVNLVRTGLWAMHRQVMLDPGRTREDSLRAMDAFVLTAVKHRIPVVFTFFSFIPDDWPSDHPYLDPRALASQREFMLSFVRRYAHIPSVGWDFINEPSVNNPRELWRTRPLPGPRESASYRAFLKKEGEGLDVLRARWNVTPADIPDWEHLELPTALDFDEWISPQKGVRLAGKAFDFQRYGQDVFTRWVEGHMRVLRKATDQLFCVGQDCGGVSNRRPTNHSFHKPLDYACNHAWWENDDLIFSAMAPAVKGKPYLVQETGMMFTDNLSREKRCTEAEAGCQFERKLASAFMNGSGFIQWCWNVNALMNDRNEVEIGAHRADRTVRPEGLVLASFGDFFRRAQEFLRGETDGQSLAVVQSFTGLWSNRSHTDLSQRASHWALGALAMPFQTLAEGEADRLTTEKVILLPSVQRIGEKELQSWVKAAQGRTLVVSGPLAQDGYGRPHSGLAAFGVKEERGEVQNVESLALPGSALTLLYTQGKTHRVDKDCGLAPRIHEFKKGKARLLYQPLPLEACDNRLSVVDFYRVLLAKAGVKPLCRLEGDGGSGAGVTVHPRHRAKTVLYAAFNEGSQDRRVKVKDGKFGFSAVLDLPAGRAALAVFDDKGRCLAAYRPPAF